jgi:hypothetical protein
MEKIDDEEKKTNNNFVVKKRQLNGTIVQRNFIAAFCQNAARYLV